MKLQNLCKLLVVFLFCVLYTNAQQNNVWCFGDSAGLNFNNLNNIPSPFKASIRTRGSCVSICNNDSNLMFYAYTAGLIVGPTTL